MSRRKIVDRFGHDLLECDCPACSGDGYDTADDPSYYDPDQVEFDPASIWCAKQNHPELVVQDLQAELGLSEDECEAVRMALLRRGVTKWLYARRLFIHLKHDVKEMLKQVEVGSEMYYLLQNLNERMQHVAKTPRWVEWPTHVHSSRKRDESEVIVKGERC